MRVSPRVDGWGSMARPTWILDPCRDLLIAFPREVLNPPEGVSVATLGHSVPRTRGMRGTLFADALDATEQCPRYLTVVLSPTLSCFDHRAALSRRASSLLSSAVIAAKRGA